MEIEKVRMEYGYYGGMDVVDMDGIRHIKTQPYLSVVQAVRGNYDIQLGGGAVHNTGSGGFFITPAYAQQTIVHHAEAGSQRMVCRWVFLRIRINDLYSFDELFDLPVILPEEYKAAMNGIFDRLFAAETVFDRYIAYYEIARILAAVAEKTKRRLPVHLEYALTFVRENYSRRITVADMAAQAKLSPSHFFSVFKKHLGMSPNTYLNSYRLSLAAEMMLKTDSTIAEIAEAVGISDSVYFNKLFRKAYQLSPRRYRETYRRGLE